MRTSTLATILVTAMAVALSCSIDRKSASLTCDTDDDCSLLQTCTTGYCVDRNCPVSCTSCDENLRTCEVDCTTGACTGMVDCPSGWSCTIDCSATGACGDIVCHDNSSCTIACAGDGACGDIACADACQCDLECVGSACGGKSCPVRGNGGNRVDCTADQTSTGVCDSSVDTRCTGC
jgi:hypothetical protein